MPRQSKNIKPDAASEEVLVDVPLAVDDSVSKEVESTKDAPKEHSAKSRRCPFCQNHTEPTYTDSTVLKKYLSDRARIIGKQRSRLCSKHQRRVTREIKHARHLALLPFAIILPRWKMMVI